MGSLCWYLHNGRWFGLFPNIDVNGLWQRGWFHKENDRECNGTSLKNTSNPRRPGRCANCNFLQLQSFIAYCAGNIVGPQLFFEREAPSYTSGFIALMVCQGVCVTLCFSFRLYLIRCNQIRDRRNESINVPSPNEPRADTVMAMMDKTDKQIADFRYVYQIVINLYRHESHMLKAAELILILGNTI